MSGKYTIEIDANADDFTRAAKRTKAELNEISRAAERENLRQRQLTNFKTQEAAWNKKARDQAFERLSLEDKITKLKERQAIISARLARTGQSELVVAGYRAKQAETNALMAGLLAQQAGKAAAGGTVAGAAEAGAAEEGVVKKALARMGLYRLVKWSKRRGIPLTGASVGGAAAVAAGYWAASSTARDAEEGAPMDPRIRAAARNFADNSPIREAIGYVASAVKHEVGGTFSKLWRMGTGMLFGLTEEPGILGGAKHNIGSDLIASVATENEQAAFDKQFDERTAKLNRKRNIIREIKESRVQFDKDLAAMNQAERETMDANWAVMEAERKREELMTWRAKYLGQYAQQDQGGLARVGMYSQAGGASYAANTVSILNEQVRLQRAFLATLQELNRKIEAGL